MIHGPLAVRKPDGIDFVGNSKISSFCKNPPPNSPIPYIWYYNTLFGRRRRAAFRRAASNARMARLRRDSATRSYQSSLASRALMSDRMWSSNGITHHQPWRPGARGLGRARASARSIAQHKRSENEGGRRNPVKSGRVRGHRGSASRQSRRFGRAVTAAACPQRPDLSAKDGRFRVGPQADQCSVAK